MERKREMADEYIVECTGHGRLDETVYPVGGGQQTYERSIKGKITRCTRCSYSYVGNGVRICVNPKWASGSPFVVVADNGFCAWGSEAVDVR